MTRRNNIEQQVMDLLVFRRLAACVAGDAIRHPTPTPPLRREGSWIEPFPSDGRGVGWNLSPQMGGELDGTFPLRWEGSL